MENREMVEVYTALACDVCYVDELKPCFVVDCVSATERHRYCFECMHKIIRAVTLLPEYSTFLQAKIG